MPAIYMIAVDVGTTSARAALVRPSGEIVAHSERAIRTYKENGIYFEQSSEEIWQSVCECIRVSNILWVLLCMKRFPAAFQLIFLHSKSDV